jgi:pimeloyl-ACP methyl ester carboxylesterase
MTTFGKAVPRFSWAVFPWGPTRPFILPPTCRWRASFRWRPRFGFSIFGLTESLFFRFLQWRTSNLTGGILDPQSPPHLTYPYVATQSLYELKKLMDLVRSELPQITVPALVVQGRKDSMVPPPNGDLVYQALGSPVKHLLYLDRSDHVVTMDYDKQTLFEKAFKFVQSDGLKVD